MKPLSIILITIAFVLTGRVAFAQIGMGGTPHPSAVLDLKSPANNKAFYPPRLTSAQRQAIANPQVGALVFDLDKGKLYLFDGQNWLPLSTDTYNNPAPIDRFASDGEPGDFFGLSVSISGDYALVGAPNDKVGGISVQGSAYVFVRSGSTWVQQANLIASDGAAADFFGASVAISGDYALIGSRADDNSKGSAYVFVRSGSTWIQQAKLIANDGMINDNFGMSVSISGDYALIGSSGDDIGNNTDQGSAYVFVRSGSSWNQQAKLTASDGATNDFFGSSVSVSGDYVLVGAPYNDASGLIDAGSAYVFLRSGSSWSQQAKLADNESSGKSNLGRNVFITGTYAVVGQPGQGTNTGLAFVFVRSGVNWVLQAVLAASDGEPGNSFGFSVSISGDYVLVGAPGAAVGGSTRQGAAYVFVRAGSSWTQLRKITGNAPATTQNGFSVCLSNGVFIIGGPGFQNYRGKVAFGTVE